MIIDPEENLKAYELLADWGKVPLEENVSNISYESFLFDMHQFVSFGNMGRFLIVKTRNQIAVLAKELYRNSESLIRVETRAYGMTKKIVLYRSTLQMKGLGDKIRKNPGKRRIFKYLVEELMVDPTGDILFYNHLFKYYIKNMGLFKKQLDFKDFKYEYEASYFEDGEKYFSELGIKNIKSRLDTFYRGEIFTRLPNTIFKNIS